MNNRSVRRSAPPRRGNGLLADPRTAGVPPDRPRVAQEEYPERVEARRQLGDPALRGLRAPPEMAAHALRRRLHRPHLARAVRRAWSHVPGRDDPPGGDGPREGAPDL